MSEVDYFMICSNLQEKLIEKEQIIEELTKKLERSEARAKSLTEANAKLKDNFSALNNLCEKSLTVLKKNNSGYIGKTVWK